MLASRAGLLSANDRRRPRFRAPYTAVSPAFTAPLTSQARPSTDLRPTRYQQAIDNPANHAQFLEIETNDEETVGYWQFLTAENHITNNVRYVP